MRFVQAEVAYLNKLVRELMAGSAAGFATLAIVLALITFLQIDNVVVYLKQANYGAFGESSRQLIPLPITNVVQASSDEEIAGYSLVGTATVAVTPTATPPVSVADVPVDVLPVLPPADHDNGNNIIGSDKKQVNDGVNRTGNYNSSFNANENSYDKKDKTYG